MELKLVQCFKLNFSVYINSMASWKSKQRAGGLVFLQVLARKLTEQNCPSAGATLR